MVLNANMSICIFMIYSMEMFFSSFVECDIIIKNDILRINLFQTLKCDKTDFIEVSKIYQIKLNVDSVYFQIGSFIRRVLL